jgi:CheY-like chemotaxis protein
VGETLRALSMRAQRKGLELTFKVAAAVPDALKGDPGRLRQVLINLVGNAIKFTSRGEVVVIVGLGGAMPSEGEVELRVCVEDTGIGIPLDKQAKVFLAFEQADMSTSRAYGGTGLGLTIAARLVTMMRGQISLESEPGLGSTFTFTARFMRAEEQRQGEAQGSESAGMRLLIVDDNVTTRMLLERWSRCLQLDPASVGDYAGALETLHAASLEGRPFALAVIEANLQGGRGLALAEHIRSERSLAATRLILLTPGDVTDDWERGYGLVVDAQVPKPVAQDELYEAIQRLTDEQRREAARPASPAQAAAGAELPVPSTVCLNVLVAEDNPLNSQLIVHLLTTRGHQVTAVENGAEALRELDSKAFDLLLVDLHMPIIDGFEVVERLRARERSTGLHLPVVTLTARARAEDRARCLAAGMDDFLVKPIDRTALWSVIERAGLDKVRRSDGRCLIDARTLLDACDSDASLFSMLRATLLSRLPQDLAALEQACLARDFGRLRDVAHSLRGMVITFSAPLGMLASTLEDAAQQRRHSEAQAALARIQTLTPALVRALEAASIESLAELAADLAQAGLVKYGRIF